MRKVGFALMAGIFISIGVFPGREAVSEAAQTGAILFKEHCAVCHENGGNIINPKRPLHKKEREANGVKTSADIIKLMRNPGPGMSQFDEKTISDQDAQKIADYILKTF